MSSDKIRIDTEKLESISQQFENLSRSLASVSSSIVDIISAARFTVPEQDHLIYNISSLNIRVRNAGAYAHKVSGEVRKASARWAEAEQRVAGKSIGTVEDETAKGGAGGSSGSSGLSDILKFLIGLAGPGAVIVPKLISTAWSAIKGLGLRDWLKLGVSGVGWVAEKVFGSKVPWKDLTPKGAVNHVLGNGFSWAVSGIQSAIDNWDLLKEGNIPRFITETASQTAVDMLMAAGGTALAAAGIAALGLSAPAWVVGLAGAGICIGVNYLAKLVIGKSIPEAVGDVVGEVTDFVVDKGKALIETGARVVTNAGKAIGNFFSHVFG